MKKFTALAVIAALSVSACSNSPYAGNRAPAGGKTEIGTLLGAAGGAVAGAQFGKGRGQLAGVAIGTLLGAAIGNSIGESLDKSDMMYYNQTSQRAFETARTGTTSQWHNPDSGHSGSVTVTNTYQQGNTYCREYNEKVNIGGKVQNAYGTACRQPDGSWQIASN